MRDWSPSAHRASSWSPESTTMRCGSSGTAAVSGCTPAALCAGRGDGPGSGAAGSAAHDSSGRRVLPNTPAPTIWVVLVITDAALATPLPEEFELQPLQTA